MKIIETKYKGYHFRSRLEARWDHVSVAPLKRNKLPTWEQMCKVKELFFKPEEAVIQIHPPKDEYVNNMPNCLHLWRANDKEMILPPSFMVGLKKGQTMSELQDEIDKYFGGAS